METKNPQPVLEELERLLKKKSQMDSAKMFHLATPEHNPSKKKGIGFTRKNKNQSKKARKAAKLSRKINRGK